MERSCRVIPLPILAIRTFEAITKIADANDKSKVHASASSSKMLETGEAISAFRVETKKQYCD